MNCIKENSRIFISIHHRAEFFRKSGNIKILTACSSIAGFMALSRLFSLDRSETLIRGNRFICPIMNVGIRIVTGLRIRLRCRRC